MNKEILIKQLLYRSNHRGCKETDILLGKFFNEKHSEFDDEKLKIYRSFIEEDDVFIYDWVTDKIDVPMEYGLLVGEIREFHGL
jgi:antitoxin CptB